MDEQEIDRWRHHTSRRFWPAPRSQSSVAKHKYDLDFLFVPGITITMQIFRTLAAWSILAR